jgi:hypothetical protein
MTSKIVFAVLFFSGLSLQGELLFEPTGLSSMRGSWHKSINNREEYYYDYSYRGKVVFRVLERYTLAVDRLIIFAMENKLLVSMANGTSYFDTQTQIDNNLKTKSKGPVNNSLIIDPHKLTLSTIWKIGKKSYWMSFSNQATGFRISKNVYDKVAVAKNAAIADDKMIKISLHALRKDFHSDQEIIWLITPEISPDRYCVVCLDNEKNTMCEPCNHVCLCENCATQVGDACPLCRANSVSKKKVYF